MSNRTTTIHYPHTGQQNYDKIYIIASKTDAASGHVKASHSMPKGNQALQSLYLPASKLCNHFYSASLLHRRLARTAQFYVARMQQYKITCLSTMCGFLFYTASNMSTYCSLQ